MSRATHHGASLESGGSHEIELPPVAYDSKRMQLCAFFCFVCQRGQEPVGSVTYSFTVESSDDGLPGFAQIP
ncbi:hypothetical protein RSSM_01684 [Rhodopirellula sallentina SM41]|uniref:Uncharacterized protein n=1 Tax=Rhodopirellula sallentina SM41 TaxID=1263870 RepID=M5ULE2_9BACT|nr:hypothetical protein RSSM_01684 [Rhodopirellula sallentina SM41]